MFTDAGDEACEQILLKLEASVEAGILTRNALTEYTRKLINIVQETHPEVWDTEPQYELANQINLRVCVPQGWQTVERWDW